MIRKKLLLIGGCMAAGGVFMLARTGYSQPAAKGAKAENASESRIRAAEEHSAAALQQIAVIREEFEQFRNTADESHTEPGRLENLERKTLESQGEIEALRKSLSAAEAKLSAQQGQMISRSEFESLKSASDLATDEIRDVSKRTENLVSMLDDVRSQLRKSERTMSAVFGRGILTGLEVIGVPGNEYVIIKPGSAIDAQGDLIVVSEEKVLRVEDLSSPEKGLFVVLDAGPADGVAEPGICRAPKVPDGVVVLGQVIRNGTDPLSIDAACRSRHIAPPAAAK